MGVPAFYRWLLTKYPNTVVNAVEEHDSIDLRSENPNRIEFDNLYLDMNGIIHPCFHPENQMFMPSTFEEVFNNMFEYIDRIFRIVRPRKILFLAIDGVAPRAKMNQQRTRRFQTAKQNELAENEETKLRIQFENEGKEVLPRIETETSDSNIITPGTYFMYRLSKELHKYIRVRMDNEPSWKEVKVILSDANVPGEGEHKIMSFIRLQRTLPNNNPNTRHCLYGLDADLIMLALATHEIHFSVLREKVLAEEKKTRFESSPAITNHETDKENGSSKSRGWFKQYPEKQEQISDLADTVKRKSTIVQKPYQFLHVWILREYLELDMKDAIPSEKFNLERVIDDFIFICFFVGNDFLPHMPTLDIHEGAIDLLMHVYKTEFNNLGDYLVDMEKVECKHAGYIKLSRVEKFILKVGTYEEKIFSKRSALQERNLRRILAEFERNRDEEEAELVSEFDKNSNGISRAVYVSDEDRTNQILENTKEMKEKMKLLIRKQSDTFKDGFLGTDKVKLGSFGCKERYYKHKFSVEKPGEIESIRNTIVKKYTEGLCWVLRYYFSGVASWTWYYPYHYGPFASDLKGLSQTKVMFEKGLPFKPFNQLLGVLPPSSAHALPPVYRPLMLDESSEIIDFFPTDFEVDLDGKRFQWQGVVKLSFIDEGRLLAVTGKLEKDLNDDELFRNSRKSDRVFFRSTSNSKELDDFIGIKSNSPDFEFPQDENVLCLNYDLPSHCHFIPRLLEGVSIPEKTVSESDIEETTLWHEYQGYRPNNSNKYPQTTRKVYTDFNATSANMSTPILKPSGNGFIGRGKTVNSDATFVTNRVEFCSNGVQNMRISNPNRDYGRGSQQVYPNVWTRKSNPRDNMYDSATGRGRGPNVNYGNDGAAISNSSRGRGVYVNYRNSGAAISANGYRRGECVNYGNNGAGVSTYGSGRGEYVNYNNGGAAATSAYSSGRGRYVNYGNDRGATSAHGLERGHYVIYDNGGGATTEHGRGRGHYVINDNGGGVTSVHGRGRGQYVNNGSSRGTSWNPKKYNVNQGADSEGPKW